MGKLRESDRERVKRRERSGQPQGTPSIPAESPKHVSEKLHLSSRSFKPTDDCNPSLHLPATEWEELNQNYSNESNLPTKP